MKNREMSVAMMNAGMLYFEYDPILHTATRPDNISDDGWPDTMEDFPETMISNTIHNPKHAERFRQAFKNMDQGAHHEYLEVELSINKEVRWFAYNLIGLPENNKIVCIATDISEHHAQGAMEKLLLRKRFDGVTLINTRDDSYMVRFHRQITHHNLGKVCQGYAMHNKEYANKYISPQEHSVFLEKTSLKTIKANLDNQGKYSFIINGFNYKHEKQLHLYSYYYMDDTKQIILATLEDVTNITQLDALTGELSREGFNRYVEEFLENCQDRKDYMILFYDIRSFKAINALLGLEGGDALLKEVGQLLRRSFLKPIAVARLEADHFALFIYSKNMNYAQLTDFCHRKFTIYGKTLSYYGCCGVYHVTDVETTVDSMCDRARLAKNYVEDDYVRPYAVYDKMMRREFVKKRIMLNDLENGVSQEQFMVQYQPVYDVVTEKIVSAEALVRWKHPHYGTIAPGEFITAFEETGHITQLDALVENKAKNFILNRLSQGKHIVPIAINLSRMDFYDNNFMNKILDDVRDIQQLDKFCRLEITESAYSALIDHAAEHIQKFKDAGIKILLDDFGSGYSSFSTISEFDFDILKLDIGFIRMIGMSAKVEKIIKSIIDMAHSLELQVVAEGVETTAQKDFLLEHRCDYIQGYYYSKPLSEEDFIQLLDKTIEK